MHVRFLASDDLLGREAGTPGANAAARYIAESFRRSGVRMLPGWADYYQRFQLKRIAPVAERSLFQVGDSTRTGGRLMLLAGNRYDNQVEGVYVGYGATRADYAGKFVRGRIVIARCGTSQPLEATQLLELSARKRALADSLHVAGLVELYEIQDFQWEDWSRYFTRPRYVLKHDQPGLAHAWVDDRTGTLRRIFEARPTDRVRLDVAGVQVGQLPVQNVVGLIPGSDLSLSYEYVLLSANYDHRGAGLWNRLGSTAADSIFNGARNNATGTTALIYASENLAKNPPKRSVLLFATTGVDLGHFGPQFFISNTPFSLSRLIFDLNASAGEITDTSRVVLIGGTRTTAASLAANAAQSYGLGVHNGEGFEALYTASANWTFAQQGIPSVSLSPGFSSLRPNFEGTFFYSPNDHADSSYPYRYLVKYSQTYARLARLIADSPTRVKWTETDPLVPLARGLYGSSY